MTKYICLNCEENYPEKGLPHLCEKCGGVYGLTDLSYSPGEYRMPGILRYEESLNLPLPKNVNYLGEAQTPLIRLDASLDVYAKLENLNPSGSFKDRGTAALMLLLLKRGIREVIEDSSGNAGASLALYTAAHGIKSHIYIPDGTSGAKRVQIERFSSSVIKVPGARENAHLAAIEAVTQKLPYASHALLPFGMSGYATIAFEIYESLGRLPGTVISPVGHGSLFLALILGFQAIHNSISKGSQPDFIGVQPDNCDPVVKAFEGKTFSGIKKSSIAEGTQLANPQRGQELLDKLDKEKDRMVSLSDRKILDAWEELHRRGIDVEPTSAMVWGAYETLRKSLTGPVVLIMTGSGLKYTN